jgi:integrase
LRLGEVAGLAWQRVDLDRWQLRLTGKGGKFRLVTLHPALSEVLHEHRARTRRQQHVLSRIDGRELSPNSLGRIVRTLVHRAGVEIDSPSHAFRRTVATVMYEHGVRTRVIERIMGWSPRQMHERHYLRVAGEPMHDAINTLYREDPICERQQRTLRSVAELRPDIEPTAWLAGESARLEALEQKLGLRAS